MKENIRILIRRYAGHQMSETQEDSENDLLDSILELVGIEMGKELGRSGGQATLEKHGKEHFSKIAKGWVKGRKRKTS